MVPFAPITQSDAGVTGFLGQQHLIATDDAGMHQHGPGERRFRIARRSGADEAVGTEMDRLSASRE